MTQKKRPFTVTAQIEGRRADISISGVIGDYEGTRATDMDRMVRDMVAQGARDAHVRIDSEGGSVLEAKRVVLSLRKFPGRVTGEGGAMVASAATYIGVKLDHFAVRRDTAYMIHKPSGVAAGNEDEVESDLKALRDITKEYRAAYAQKTGKSEEDIEALWSKGDRWYTGEEAVAEGLVDGLVESDEQPDAVTVARIAASGCPKDKLPTARPATGDTNKNDMDIKALRATLGMPDTASEAEVLARVNALKESEANAKAAAKARLAERIKSILDKAIAERKLTEKHRASYEAKFKSDFEATKAEVEALEAAPDVAGIVHAGKAEGKAVANGRADWNYDKWANKDEKGLKAMMTEDPERFKALYVEHYGVEPQLPA